MYSVQPTAGDRGHSLHSPSPRKANTKFGRENSQRFIGNDEGKADYSMDKSGYLTINKHLWFVLDQEYFVKDWVGHMLGARIICSAKRHDSFSFIVFLSRVSCENTLYGFSFTPCPAVVATSVWIFSLLVF